MHLHTIRTNRPRSHRHLPRAKPTRFFGRGLLAIVLTLVCAAFGSLAATPLFAQTLVPIKDAQTEAAPQDTAAEGVVEPQNAEAKFQSTYVWQRHPAFPAAYSGPNSFGPEAERRSYTLTATAFLGARVWAGGEVHFNPEMIASQSLSNLHGLGALTNGENQKGGGPEPTFYRARLFLRETWNLGGGRETVESAPNQLAGAVDKHRIVLTVGNVSLIDLFDNNAYSHEPRSQFLNWTIMTHGAFDYAADSRGYTVGAAVEYYRGAWALRAGRFEQPKESNGLPLDSRIFAHYGDQVEIEHDHEIVGQPGRIRLLAFHNRARMGGFQDALDAWRAGGRVGVPSVAAVRRDRDKYGWGINLEQSATADAGLVLRGSANDGRSETYAFTEVERSLSGGVAVKGSRWSRPDDTVGLAFAVNGLSAAHRDYLAHGGLGAFIGDGVPPPGTNFHYARESVFETYYNVSLAKGTQVSIDLQRAGHPAYNADRGPVNVLGARIHIEL